MLQDWRLSSPLGELDQTPETAILSSEAAAPPPETAAAEERLLAPALAQGLLVDPDQASRDYAAAAAAAAAGTAAAAAAAVCDRLPSRQQSFENLPGSWVVLSWQHAESAGQLHSCRAQPGWLCSAS